jgi:4-hydroxybenzoate polyprenyltransferase
MNRKLLIQWVLLIIAAFAFSCFSKEKLSILDISETDTFQYHVQAVNLAKYNEFPQLEIKNNLREYSIDTTQEIGLSSKYALNLILKHPPVDDFSKPPLYSLILAFVYKIFGTSPLYGVKLNLFLIAFIAFSQPLVGWRLMGWCGIIAGLISGFLYMQVSMPDVLKFYPHLLVQFFILLIYWIQAGKDNKQPNYPFLLGILLGAMLLTNGNTLFIPGFLLLYYLFQFYKGNSPFRPIAILFIGILVCLIPWIAFSNFKLQTTKAERKLWVESVLNDGKPDQIFSPPLFKNYPNFDSKDSAVMFQCVRELYSKTCMDGIVIISKQPYGDEIIGTHTERNLDGNFHPEWRYNSQSYYQKLPKEQNALLKIFHFYLDNPKFIWTNLFGKYKGTFYDLTPVFVSTVFLLGFGFFIELNLTIVCLIFSLCYFGYSYQWFFILLLGLLPFAFIRPFLKKFNSQIPIVTTATLFNVLFISFVFIGVERYVQPIDSIIILSLFFIIKDPTINSFLMIKEFISKGIYSIINSKIIGVSRVLEATLMTGYFIVAFLFNFQDNYVILNSNTLLSYVSIWLYVMSVYSLNSYVDYKEDILNPRLKILSSTPRNTYLILIFAFLLPALANAWFIHWAFFTILSISWCIWAIYYIPPFRLKSKFPFGTILHFFSGITHFALGYMVFNCSILPSLKFGLFFALFLSIGHLNHERIDATSDSSNGLKTGAVIYNVRFLEKLFLIGFLIGQIYWIVLFYLEIINLYYFLSFFYLPIILIIKKFNLIDLKSPNNIQLVFRILFSISLICIILIHLLPLILE